MGDFDARGTLSKTFIKLHEYIIMIKTGMMELIWYEAIIPI